MRWNEMKWDEMRWNEMKWDGCQEKTSTNKPILKSLNQMKHSPHNRWPRRHPLGAPWHWPPQRCTLVALVKMKVWKGTSQVDMLWKLMKNPPSPLVILKARSDAFSDFQVFSLLSASGQTEPTGLWSWLISRRETMSLLEREEESLKNDPRHDKGHGKFLWKRNPGFLSSFLNVSFCGYCIS